MLKLYNTETRTKEEIQLQGDTLTMYTCGPTVYNYAHIGNFRTYVFEDLLRRTIKSFDFPLKQVMNLTDVEDKTIKGAIEAGVPLATYTQTYKDAFFEDLKTLYVEPVEIYSPATDYIPQMITMIEALIEKGFAYQGKDGGVYYRLSAFPSYGRLSHLKLDELQEGASERVSDDEYDKESATDFVLWKSYDAKRDGDIFWESPFGKGRPGWHVECSAMATSLLGPTIDIHVGGVDNIFPHHENEIAQSEGCTGKHFVRHWLHAEHLIVDGKKMSKSLGNFYTLRDLLDKGYTGAEVRYLLLATHYRTQLNFTFEGLEAARQTLTRISDFVHRLRSAAAPTGAAAPIDDARTAFKGALGDDLNISVALAALFDFMKKVNTLIDAGQLTANEATRVLDFLQELNTVLAVLPLEEKELEIPAAITAAFEKRQAARAAKDWAEADKQRDYIHEQGYLIEDSPTGSRVKPL
ncbi:cysteine--tRNA ligase [Candidatus Neptunochlamydia vexilliferae]|uniref:Cysteine--tRNA ligase n=1 Tax=Candidatus Neptunichlamydia vexilliferae TaxID=1651774 RepID=A0ABS0AYG9_9BACT|nr:cysteine--tRNA ligase [Candidatus Neptunochlamydia vexilliferae]MBF5059174.1 Cysteine--tRNA ligase [Candidatus Neptunochlamydia vexilliferae]